MVRKSLAVALATLAVALGGCDIGVRADASKAIERFLTAVHNDDRKAFEAAIDRDALRADLRDQLTALHHDALQLVEARTGQALPAAPNAAAIALMMQVRDRSHVCVGDPGKPRCALSFAKREGTWRLVGMQATDLKIAVPPVPKKK